MTEKEKAKKNTENYKNPMHEGKLIDFGRCIEHKKDCEDFLEFLRSEYYCRLTEESVWKNDTIRKKQEDLKEAIKIYENEGF